MTFLQDGAFRVALEINGLSIRLQNGMRLSEQEAQEIDLRSKALAARSDSSLHATVDRTNICLSECLTCRDPCDEHPRAMFDHGLWS
jgi:hypothetical protein